MKRWVRDALIGCFGFAVVSGVLLTWVWPTLWWREFGTVVSVDGQPFVRAAVYRNYDGRLLVRVPSPLGAVPFVVWPSGGSVGIADSSDFLARTGLFLVAQEEIFDTVDIAGASEREAGDPRLVYRRGGYVEFSTPYVLTSSPTHPVWCRVRVPLRTDNKK